MKAAGRVVDNRAGLPGYPGPVLANTPDPSSLDPVKIALGILLI